MFSVIIPLYNKEKYVEKALHSVLNQTFKEFEVIVVDDGSTDHSLDKVQKFNPELNSGSKVQIVEQQNSGVSIARNNGVAQAIYDYIAFLDADDWWEPTFLEEMAKLISSFPKAGIYGSNYFYIKNKQKRIVNIGVNRDFQSGYINYFGVYAKTLAMPLWTGAVVLRKDVFNEMQGFKPNLKLGEDFDLWIRIALKYPVVFLNKSLSNYNQDVEVKHRGIGRLHQPENHILWNLDYLTEEEKQNADLKRLLDNLRVYSLFPYYLNKSTRENAITELTKVDWTQQPKSAYNKYYKTPVIYLKLKQRIRLYGSWIKSWIIRRAWKLR